jgi:hypothetical protein
VADVKLTLGGARELSFLKATLANHLNNVFHVTSRPDEVSPMLLTSCVNDRCGMARDYLSFLQNDERARLTHSFCPSCVDVVHESLRLPDSGIRTDRTSRDFVEHCAKGLMTQRLL